MEEIMVQAIRNKGVENRTLAFYLHDMAKCREHQQLGFSTTEGFAEARLEMSPQVAHVRHRGIGDRTQA